MPNSIGSTKCLAVSFVKQLHTPSCAMNIFDLFMSFKYINITGQRNLWLSQAVQNCYLLGHFEPYVLLIGGSDCHLQVVKLSWMRMQLKSPFGFTIDSISDAGGLLMQRVPQYRTMRLEEVICQLIWQNTQTEASCNLHTLISSLQRVYADLNMQPPSLEATQSALSALLAAGAVYFSGHGYSLLTPDKLAVAKWLENVPEAVSLSDEPDDVPASNKAPLADTEPYLVRIDEADKSYATRIEPTLCEPYAVSAARFSTHHSKKSSPYEVPSSFGSPHLAAFPSIPKRVSIEGDTKMQSPGSLLSYTHSPMSASFLALPSPRPSPNPTPISNTMDYRRIARHRLNRLPLNDRLTAVNRSQVFSSAVQHNRSSTLDSLPHTSNVPLCVEAPAQTKPSPTSFVKWIIDRFRGLRLRSWRPNAVSQGGTDIKHTPERSAKIYPVPLHRKSRSAVVSGRTGRGDDLCRFNSPNKDGKLHSIPHSPLPYAETRSKLSHLGNLRRCFSLAEDGVNQDAGDGEVALPLVSSFVPNLSPGPTVVKHNSALLLHSPGNLQVVPPKWISHQDLLGSSSYLSLVARPAMSQLDPSSTHHSTQLPSHSVSRLTIHDTADRLQNWTCESKRLATPCAIGQRAYKRPATRDSGFVESECANTHTQPNDRSALYSASPMSKSSEGVVGLLNTDSTVWSNRNTHSPHVWWTTGFQHPSQLALDCQLTQPPNPEHNPLTMYPVHVTQARVVT